MSEQSGQQQPTQQPTRRPGELTARELGRFVWRQLTSMRTALVLLLLLALAAVPGSVIPQESVDSFGARQWKDQHESLTPIYEALGLFDVYGSVWFAAVYVLLMVSLVGCILPRTKHYWTAARAVPPVAASALLSEHTLAHPDIERAGKDVVRRCLFSRLGVHGDWGRRQEQQRHEHRRHARPQTTHRHSALQGIKYLPRAGRGRSPNPSIIAVSGKTFRRLG